MIKKIFGILCLLLIVWIFSAKDSKTYSTCNDCSCECGSCEIPSIFPLPTWFPHCTTPTPTLEITPTPTPQQEITPTPTTGNGEETTPTPTTEIIPTITPTPTTSNGGGQGSPGGGSSNDPGDPYVCLDPAPSTPTLLSENKQNDGSVLLNWTESSPVTHYGISYGTTSGEYKFGQTDVGNQTSYTVGSLDKSQNYCFVVNAVNGCASSSFSNEICTGSVLGTSTGGQVLGLSTTSGNNMGIKLVTSIIGLLCLMFGIRLRKV